MVLLGCKGRVDVQVMLHVFPRRLTHCTRCYERRWFCHLLNANMAAMTRCPTIVLGMVLLKADSPLLLANQNCVYRPNTCT